MLEQTAVSSAKTEDGSVLLPLKAVDWTVLTSWDWVECLFDDVLVPL